MVLTYLFINIYNISIGVAQAFKWCDIPWRRTKLLFHFLYHIKDSRENKYVGVYTLNLVDLYDPLNILRKFPITFCDKPGWDPFLFIQRLIEWTLIERKRLLKIEYIRHNLSEVEDRTTVRLRARSESRRSWGIKVIL